jgi:hypothetical protein
VQEYTFGEKLVVFIEFKKKILRTKVLRMTKNKLTKIFTALFLLKIALLQDVSGL